MDEDMEDPEKSLCASPEILRNAIEKKYLRWCLCSSYKKRKGEENYGR
jgi:hypothetical protein